MSDRIISISAAPYDGYEFPAMLDSIASCGAQYVEPAFIVGYTEAFDESSFNLSKVPQYATWLKQSGLQCFAFSAHVDLGQPGLDEVFARRMDFAQALGARIINTNAAKRTNAEGFFHHIQILAAHLDLGQPGLDEVFARRMDFARALGARIINTNAAKRTNAEGFFHHIQILAAHAERLEMTIGLENPGNGEDNLFNLAQDGLGLLERIGSPYVRLNYDAGNTASHRPGRVDPAQDALLAMPGCGHIHLKDVQARSDGYYFVPIGEGDIDCATILQALKSRPDLNLAIEIPLRFHRNLAAQPCRNESPVNISEIESALRKSLNFVHPSQEFSTGA